MGTIRKQSIIGTIYTYLGALIGFITTILLFPKFLEEEQIGILGIIVSYSMVLSTLGNLGIGNVIVRFFPYFRSKDKKHNGLLFISTIVPLIGFVLAVGIFFIIQFYLEKDPEGNKLIHDYFIYTIPMIFVALYFNIFEAFYRMLFNITFSTLFKEVVQRIIHICGVLLLYLSIIDFGEFVLVYIFAFAVPMLAMIMALVKGGHFHLTPKLKFIDKKLFKSMSSLAFFSIISAFAGIVIINVDKIMIERMLGLDYVGIYITVFYFGNLVIMPSRPLLKISSAFIAEAWKSNDLKLINSIYVKSSINQFIIGCLIVVGLWSNIHNIISILPPEYAIGKYVILLISITYLSDMASGSNGAILVNSNAFKYQTYIMVVLIALAIITNIIFIPLWGIIGAAFASLLSKTLANLLRILVLYRHFKLFPFKMKHIKVLLISIAVYSINLAIPIFENYIFDIFLRSSAIIIAYGLVIYFVKVSSDMNEVVDKTLKKYLKL